MAVRSWRLLGGILLIVTGCLFLLRSLGIIQAALWGLLIPIFLIALGAWGMWSASQSGRLVSEHLAVPSEGATRAAVTIRYGAGRLRISGGATPGVVLAGDFAGGAVHRVQRNGDELTVDLYRPPEGWMTAGVPWAETGGPEWDVHPCE